MIARNLTEIPDQQLDALAAATDVLTQLIARLERRPVR